MPAEDPWFVLTSSSVKVEGSEEPGTQLTMRGEVRSTVVPEKGEVNVRAREVVTIARREIRRNMFEVLTSAMCSPCVGCLEQLAVIAFTLQWSVQHAEKKAQLA